MYVYTLLAVVAALYTKMMDAAPLPQNTTPLSGFTTDETTASYDPSSYTPPSYDPSSYTPPSYDPSSYTPPSYTPPSYTPPSSYDPSSYTPSSYDPSSYTPPSYTPPSSYDPSSYTPPSYTPPSYTPPSSYAPKVTPLKTNSLTAKGVIRDTGNHNVVTVTNANTLNAKTNQANLSNMNVANIQNAAAISAKGPNASASNNGLGTTVKAKSNASNSAKISTPVQKTIASSSGKSLTTGNRNTVNAQSYTTTNQNLDQDAKANTYLGPLTVVKSVVANSGPNGGANANYNQATDSITVNQGGSNKIASAVKPSSGGSYAPGSYAPGESYAPGGGYSRTSSKPLSSPIKTTSKTGIAAAGHNGQLTSVNQNNVDTSKKQVKESNIVIGTIGTSTDVLAENGANANTNRVNNSFDFVGKNSNKIVT